jgi:cyclase
MFRPRIIPVLLLKGQGLVKTVRFSNEKYVGDPINAVRIFNDLEADELTFLDISATKENRTISVDLVKQLGDEAYMPFAVGGGISDLKTIGSLLRAGAEKVVLNAVLEKNPFLIREAAKSYGNQSIIASIDIKKNLFGKYNIYVRNGSKKLEVDLFDYIHELEELGAGEILLTSIDHDGTYKGYDLKLTKSVAEAVGIPVITSGGASSLQDLKLGYVEGKASAVAAGSIFVYHGARRAVLINYPTKDIINLNFRID